jgi:hydroxyquinol 1,2-dioxygenase
MAVRKIDEFSITDMVIDSFADAKNERLKLVMTSLIKHIHAFARDVDLTPEEWIEGIKFLTAVGQYCTPTRQEFIIMSDTMGLTTLVNSLNDRKQVGATQSSNLGPFYRENAPDMAMDELLSADSPGERIRVAGRVLDGAGKPVEGALLDVWQASAEGFYDIQDDKLPDMALRARFRTGPDGSYSFRTVLPDGYPVPTDGPMGPLLHALGRHCFRPAHYHFILTAPGFESVVTALYPRESKYVDSDVVFGVSEPLVVDVDRSGTGNGKTDLPIIRYDFLLRRVEESTRAAKSFVDQREKVAAAR